MRALLLAAALLAPAAGSALTVEEAFVEALLQKQLRDDFKRGLAAGERRRRENVLRVDDDSRPKREGASGVKEGASGVNSKSDWDEILRKAYVAWPRLKFPDGESYRLDELCVDGGELQVAGRPEGKLCLGGGDGACGASKTVRLAIPLGPERGTYRVFVYASAKSEQPLFERTWVVASCSGR